MENAKGAVMLFVVIVVGLFIGAVLVPEIVHVVVQLLTTNVGG